MREWEEKRAEDLAEYILITQIVSLLLFSMIIASFFNLKLGSNLKDIYKLYPFHALFLLYIFVYILNRFFSRNALPPKIDEILLVVITLSLTFGFLWYSKDFFAAKILIIIPAIIAATAFGKYAGIGVAVISGALLFFFDYGMLHALPDIVFQTDLIVGSVAAFSAWIMGGLMEIEKNTQRELIKLADYDHLTGLYNHRYLQEKLALSLQKAVSEKAPVSVIMFDIEQFRYYNAVCGYQKGDDILTVIGKTLLAKVEEPFFAARFGSDEFAVVFPGLDKDDALKNAAELDREIRARVMEFLSGSEKCSKPFTISTGFAGYPGDGDEALPLIRTAENDLFRTKYSRGKPYLYQSVLSEISTLKIKDAFPTLQTLVTLINTKDKYTFGHSERVMSYSLALAEKLKLSEEEKDFLRYGAYLHDIGKIEIETSILNKEGSLDKDEWTIMKNHAVYGTGIIQPLAAFKEIVPVVRFHHENYDGSGYPDGLRGEEIPLLARILRIADSFDAMTTDRPYRKALSFSEACREIERCAGRFYDPSLVPVFLEAVEDVFEAVKDVKERKQVTDLE
ncbi:MAG: diguanylate cyclase [Bacillota bacterium]